MASCWTYIYDPKITNKKIRDGRDLNHTSHNCPNYRSLSQINFPAMGDAESGWIEDFDPFDEDVVVMDPYEGSRFNAYHLNY